ncbi:MAG TPA: AMP nucleosidase [Alphaproteobacteria bacterium]
MPISLKPFLPGEEEVTVHDPIEALLQLERIYTNNIAYLRQEFSEFARGGAHKPRKISACYPYIRLDVTEPFVVKTKLAFGHAPGTGRFTTTVTRPDLFGRYYLQQLSLLKENHNVPFTVGVSTTPIPIHFALGDMQGMSHVESGLNAERLADLPHYFDLPNLSDIDDRIANGEYDLNMLEQPLALFTAPRTDISLHRLRHYTGTLPDYFQNFVIFTNYGFYVDEFARFARDLFKQVTEGELSDTHRKYTALVEPGNVITPNANLPPRDWQQGVPLPRQPQMPAYHLMADDAMGITLINIGVGPSNAKNISDHVAVLRPHAWLMLGHCAGLRKSQELGDYVLAHAYLRDDHVLDADMPTDIPIPALAEIQIALQQAVAEVTDLKGSTLKKVMRTGTVATTDDRNWELQDHRIPLRRLKLSRAIALDMESATIATNGYRMRVPYGTLLCVSDKPLHGQIKLPGMADEFYRRRVNQHLQIGIRTMEKLQALGMAELHSRKLRNFNEVPFQ